jgi:xylan 1,4-beta-xylosidase
MRRVSVIAVLGLCIAYLGAGAVAEDVLPVTIEIDVQKPIGELKPIWRFFGADEPNYAYMKDGRKLLGELGKLGPQDVYFRAHNLLTTGDGTPALKWGSTNAYREDQTGEPVYDWTILDRIFDAYHAVGLKAYVEIGFMPQALSIKPEPYQHRWHPGARYEEIYTGWAYPPRDYGKWAELVNRWARHAIERYGADEVARWYWETWNEPNIGYWRGTPDEFYKLHDYATDAVRKALPNVRVGGPDSAGGGTPFLRKFLEHTLRGSNAVTGRTGTPLDFVSFHAKGAPGFVNGHVRMGIANQLRDIDSAFRIIASFPELKNTPIVIGESDPDGCAACQGERLGYRNTTMYSSYTAASIAREFELADRHGVNLEGALTWAFEFEDQPYFAGFRVLATNGIDLPVLNVFRMLGKMSGQRLAVKSSSQVPLDQILKAGVRAGPEVSALASLAPDGKVCVLLWYYHDDDLVGPDARIDLELSGLPAQTQSVQVTRFLVDHDHSNAFTAWHALGSPTSPTPPQYAQLEQAGQLAEVKGDATTLVKGAMSLNLSLARQGVALLVMEPK